MDSESEFLEKYSLNAKTLEKFSLKLETLIEIEKDYSIYKSELVKPAEMIVESLTKMNEAVSSLNYRIKGTDSLLKKIVTKRREDLKDLKKAGGKGFAIRNFNVASYKNEITDLLGVRVLILLKGDLMIVHEKISEWMLNENPVCYYRLGDEDFELYKNMNIQMKQHKNYYRSVHYVVKFPFEEKTFLCEIQVRTISDHIFASMDHKLFYKQSKKDKLIKDHLNVLNRICGTTDEYCANIYSLNEKLKRKPR